MVYDRAGQPMLVSIITRYVIVDTLQETISIKFNVLCSCYTLIVYNQHGIVFSRQLFACIGPCTLHACSEINHAARALTPWKTQQRALNPRSPSFVNLVPACTPHLALAKIACVVSQLSTTTG